MPDILITPVASGLEISIDTLGIVESSAISTAVYLSLFTAPWWGDSLADAIDRYNSAIPEILNRGVLTESTGLNVKAAAERSLSWMISQGVAERVIVDAEIQGDILALRVTIVEGQDIPDRILSYAINWDAQRVDILR